MLRVEIQATGHGFFQRCCMFGNVPMGMEGRCTPVSTRASVSTEGGSCWDMRSCPVSGVGEGTELLHLQVEVKM